MTVDKCKGYSVAVILLKVNRIKWRKRIVIIL